jgi:SOS-response transcriptional repressor LexA
MPGQEWDLEIRKAVRNSDTVLVCLSKSSTTKEGYIQKEIRFALDIADEKPEGTIFLIPVRLEECNVPSRISRYQWVDLFEKSGYSKLKESLHLRMNDLNIRFDSTDVFSGDLEDRIRVPVLGPIATGIPLPELGSITKINYSEDDVIYVARGLLPPKEKGDDLFALEVMGDSLADAMIHDGDIVIMKPATTARNGEMAAIWLPLDNEATLKYFFKEKDRYRLQPANPEMKSIFVKLDVPLEVKGKVVMVIRRMERLMAA